MIHVARAESPAEIDAVRGLMREFNQWVMAEIAATDNPSIFARFEAELAGLPGRYGPPSGCLALARLNGEPAGCVAFYPHAIYHRAGFRDVPASAEFPGVVAGIDVCMALALALTRQHETGSVVNVTGPVDDAARLSTSCSTP